MEDKIVDKEGVFSIYKRKELVAIIKRDTDTGKHLVYLTKEATSEDISELIKNGTLFSPTTDSQ